MKKPTKTQAKWIAKKLSARNPDIHNELNQVPLNEQIFAMLLIYWGAFGR